MLVASFDYLWGALKVSESFARVYVRTVGSNFELGGIEQFGN